MAKTRHSLHRKRSEPSLFLEHAPLFIEYDDDITVLYEETDGWVWKVETSFE